MIRRILPLLLCALLLPIPAAADIPIIGPQTKSLTATGSNSVTLAGQSSCATQISGGATATVVFEETADNTNWTAVPSTGNFSGSQSSSVSASATNLYLSPVPSAVAFRARVSAYTSGTVKLTITCGPAATNFPGANAGGGTSTPAYTRVQDGAGTSLASVSAGGALYSTPVSSGGALVVTAVGSSGTVALGIQGTGVTSALAVPVVQAPATTTVIASGTNTSCTSKATTATIIHRIFSAAGSETATVSIYNEGASPTCASADLIWSGIPSNTAPILLDARFSAGWAIKTSGATVNNTVVTSN